MRSFVRASASVLAVLLVGCGNEIVVENTGGSSSSSSSSSSKSTTGTTSTSSNVTSTSTGKPPVCDGLSETQCLAAFPMCAPRYDDTCCPSCTPGPCADCVHMEFYECRPANEICGGAPLTCGFASKEACAGVPAGCAAAYCPSVPGCVEACKPDSIGQCAGIECHAVTAVSCTSTCGGVPPPCPPSMTAEQDGGCYTGFCIPDSICLP